ncbi:MAG: transglycosylase domain-containing protein, partial [Clostridia bacterium]
IDRKIHEIAIAEKLEKSYSKEEILAMYMSVIYFGGGAYGVNSASMLYFGKSPSELTLAECATLAGIVKNPSKYSPKNSILNATERRNLVLDVMLKNKAITEDECEAAKGEKLTLKTVTSNKDINKFYLDRVIEEVTSELQITKFQLNNSGFKIYTNLDKNLQKTLAEQAKNKENFGETPVDSEAVVLDNELGAVIANYSSLPYKILRQPGSALKPIAIFAPALEEKLITLATPIVDEKVSFGDFSPANFGDIYYGNTTPREAIKHSMNSVAVKIIDYLSPEKAVLYSQKFGIPLVDTDKNYALSLGATSKGVSPVKLASAYSVFARGGQQIAPHYVKYVVKGDEKLLNCNLNQTKVISAENAYLITSALIDTVKCGTAKSMSVLPFQIAAKTGTVETKNNKNTDAWNVGYTSKHTVLVWHGANGMSEKGGGRPTHHAINIWKQVYESANKTSKNDSLNYPANFESLNHHSKYDCPNYPTNFESKNNTSKCSNYPSKNDNTNYPANFVQPTGIKELKIDTYSSNVNNILTLAGKNTPEKYCKTEIFSYDNLPTCTENCFDNIL